MLAGVCLLLVGASRGLEGFVGLVNPPSSDFGIVKPPIPRPKLNPVAAVAVLTAEGGLVPANPSGFVFGVVKPLPKLKPVACWVCVFPASTGFEVADARVFVKSVKLKPPNPFGAESFLSPAFPWSAFRVNDVNPSIFLNTSLQVGK
jgi:hypothetical protein